MERLLPEIYLIIWRLHMLCLIDTLIRKYRAFDYESKK